MPSELDNVQKAIALAIQELFELAELWEPPDAIASLSSFYRGNISRLLNNKETDWKAKDKSYAASNETVTNVTAEAILACLDVGRKVNLFLATRGSKPVSFIEKAGELDARRQAERELNERP